MQPASRRVRLLDFGPVCDTTSPLLFDWDELPYQHMHSMQRQAAEQQQELQEQQEQHQQEQGPTAQKFELRIVTHAGMIMPGSRVVTGMPLDMLGLQDAFEQSLQAMRGARDASQPTAVAG